jgi:hypothetical protein
MGRPGTTDYSNWDQLANDLSSSDEDEPKANLTRSAPALSSFQTGRHEKSDEEEVDVGWRRAGAAAAQQVRLHRDVPPLWSGKCREAMLRVPGGMAQRKWKSNLPSRCKLSQKLSLWWKN